MQHVAFIINPFSAKKNYQSFLDELIKEVENPVYYISESIEGTNKFIEDNKNNIDVFVAVGGDGTISTVARNLISTDKILGIYPAGSGNGFANETNFKKDIKSLINKLRSKNYLEIDTFTVNDRLSINVSGTGFDGKVVKEFEKTSRGFKNYIKVCVKTFFKYKPIEVIFKNPDYIKYNGKYLMVNIANTRQFGNNAYIAPNAKMDDGLVDLVLVKKFPFTYSLLFAYRMFAKTLKSDQYVKYISVSNLDFKTSTQDWHLDGEYNEMNSSISIKTFPKSLRILQ